MTACRRCTRALAGLAAAWRAAMLARQAQVLTVQPAQLGFDKGAPCFVCPGERRVTATARLFGRAARVDEPGTARKIVTRWRSTAGQHLGDLSRGAISHETRSWRPGAAGTVDMREYVGAVLPVTEAVCLRPAHRLRGMNI